MGKRSDKVRFEVTGDNELKVSGQIESSTKINLNTSLPLNEYAPFNLNIALKPNDNIITIDINDSHVNKNIRYINTVKPFKSKEVKEYTNESKDNIKPDTKKSNVGIKTNQTRKPLSIRVDMEETKLMTIENINDVSILGECGDLHAEGIDEGNAIEELQPHIKSMMGRKCQIREMVVKDLNEE